MNIYLGGPSDEFEQVLSDARAVEMAGHVITERWWERVEYARGAWPGGDAAVPPAYMEESAARNDRGMRKADRVILRCRAAGGLSGGVAYELGFAKALPCDACVHVVGDPRGHIGTWGPSVRVVGTIEDALR